MTVKAILDSKGTDVATIEPSADLASAIKLLAERPVGALVVVDPERIAGIISERDVIREPARRGAAALEQPVGQVVTRKVVTCNRAETMSSIMERMTAGKFRHLPVVEERPAGRYCLDQRRREAPRAGNRTRIRDLARLHPHRIGRVHNAERSMLTSIRTSCSKRAPCPLRA